MARLATSRIVYALVGLLDLAMASVDVEAASVNVTLKEELIIRAPPMTTPLPVGYFYRLRRSLYGLKQSSKEWSVMLKEFMEGSC